MLIGEMEKAAGKGDVGAYLAANVSFHDRMVELALSRKAARRRIARTGTADAYG